MRTYRRNLIFDESKTAIHWHLSRFCDKHCSYCIAEKIMDRKNSHQYYSNDELLVHDNIYNFLLKQNNVKIELFGGEAITHPNGLKYFNGLCENSKDNSNVSIYLLTHGDLSDDIISEIDTSGKKECMFIASYHPTQVNFEEWKNRLIKLRERVNLSVVIIIPPDEKKWGHLYYVFENLLNLGFFVAPRLLSDITSHVKQTDNLLSFFKPLFERNPKGLLFGFHSTQILETIDGNEKILEAHEILEGFKPNPTKTFCSTRQFLIDERSKIGIGCWMRKELFQITADTSHIELQTIINKQHLIQCTKDICIEVNSVSTTTKIRDAK